MLYPLEGENYLPTTLVSTDQRLINDGGYFNFYMSKSIETNENNWTTVFGKGAVTLMKESRTEMRRVVWPTRMEITQTFMVVFGSIIVLCLFFWALESLLSWLTQLILG